MNNPNDAIIEHGDRSRSLLLLVLLFAFVAVMRILAPSDLHEGDQPKQADYVLDIVCNGNWTVQHHADGSVMSKPPLYNWLAAPFVMLFGAEDVFLKMPSLFAGLATLLMTWDLARRRLGERAAFWGCAFMLLTSMFAREIYFARTDMLLTCFIVMQFWAVVRWEDGGSETKSFRSHWIRLFWIAAALGNLTKGPLALLPHLALIAVWLYEGRCKERYARLGLAWGIPLAMLPLIVWFGCAYRVEGYEVYQHMVSAELIARFRSVADKIAEKGTDKSNRNFFYYFPHVVSRALPWSLFGLVGIWGVFTAKKNSELSDRQRSTLYFLAAWFFTTLLFFSVVPSKRADRIFPLIPAFCLLAGWAFDGFMKSIEARTPARLEHRIVGWIAFALAIVFIAAGIGFFGFELGADFGPFRTMHRKIPPLNLERLQASNKLAFCAGAIMMLCGTIAVGAFLKRRANWMALSLLACEIAFVALYQQALGNWMTTDVCQGATEVCRAVKKQAHDTGTQILILTGSAPSARFYLKQARLETPAKVAAAQLAQPHPAMIVVGTQPSFDGKVRKPGGLEDAGLGGVDCIPVFYPREPSTIKWLAAVFVPERK